MSGRIPAFIDPFRLAETGRVLQGDLPVAGLQRLQQVCCDDEAVVQLELSFSQADSGLAMMQGQVRSKLCLICQRCMESMDYDLDLRTRVFFSRPGQQHGDVEEADVVLVDGELDLQALLEDEIMLALPMIAKHAPQDCPAMALMSEQDEDELQKENPFAVLKNLKQ